MKVKLVGITKPINQDYGDTSEEIVLVVIPKPITKFFVLFIFLILL